jgi:hypothetical protein
MSIITDFKSIKRIMDRQEQKAEFDAKQPASFCAAVLRLTGGQPIGDWLGVHVELPDMRGRVKV